MRAIVIGAGVGGLFAVRELQKAGFTVDVFDAGPDPEDTLADPQLFGTTFRADARHISATETSPHATTSRAGLIHKSVSDGGWLAKDATQLSANEIQWIKRFDTLAKTKGGCEDFARDVIQLNNLGKDLWWNLLRTEPWLFASAAVESPVTILVHTKEAWKSEEEIEREANVGLKALDETAIGDLHPVLREACRTGAIAGGLIVDSLALNAASFCRALIRHLTEAGAMFNWDQRVSGYAAAEPSWAKFESPGFGVLKADLYVIDAGIPQGDVLVGSQAYNKIMGVAGCFIRIPNPGLRGPIKILAQEPTGFVNVTRHGTDLLLSGGYGFIGNSQADSESPGVRTLFEGLEQVARNIFPAAYQAALSSSSLSRRACARPSTPTGLPLLEKRSGPGGSRIIVAGGNSAGGFTQAPAMGRLICEAITEAHTTRWLTSLAPGRVFGA